MRAGWETKALGSVLVKTETVDPTKNPGKEFLYIDVSSVSNTSFAIENTTLLKGREAPSRARKLVRKDDIIFATVRPTLKRIALVPENLDRQVCSTGYFVLRADQTIQFKLLFYFLQTDSFIERMEKLQRGASYPAVTDADVRQQLISFPKSLPEQKRLVSILDSAFAAIDKAKANAEKNLKNAKEVFESYLQSVFANAGEGWEVKSVQEICVEIFAGGDAPNENFSSEKSEKYKIPIFANAVKDNGLYGFTNFARVTEPCITIAARGSGTGHTETRNESFLPIVRLIVLIPNLSLVTLEFLKHSIDNLEILRSGSAIPQLTVPMIKTYNIPIPSLAEQHSIVQKLSALSTETKKLETIYQQKLNDLDELKKSILQKAFAGELTFSIDKVTA